MRIFNHAFLLILCSTFAYTAGQLVFGNTITRPYSSADYAGGQKAVGAKVNAEFQSIVDWLNGGNIGPTNIATQGVATSNLADGSVTLAKMAGACCGYPTVTNSSSAFSSSTNAGVTPVTVSNLSTTFTSHGRAIYVGLEPNLSTYLLNNNQTFGSYIAVVGGSNGVFSNLFFVRNTSTTAHFNITTFSNNTGYTCSDFHYTEDALAAGTYTFSVKVSSYANLASSIAVFNCRLVVREEL